MPIYLEGLALIDAIINVGEGEEIQKLEKRR